MRIISDLQLHSKYSRAVSPQMVVPYIWEWAKRKGIGLIATGDWTHPLWMREIKNSLEEVGNGLLKLKTQSAKLKATTQSSKLDNDNYEGPLFLLSGEVSCIYSQGGKGRRIHTLIWSPTIAAAEKINAELTKRGANLMSDGRPIIGLTSIQVAEIALSADPTCLVIPAHIWTPWFSLYGSESGFDSIEECFGQYAKHIYAAETGLSSNPAMNWRIKDLDSRAIVSFSDAHSGPKLGREATVFEMEELSYRNIGKALINSGLKGKEMFETIDAIPHIAYSIEFYPEEGKYHYTGHRNCGIKQMPGETKQKGVMCRVCGRKLTVGVMHRVEDLAGRSEGELKLAKKPIPGIQMNGTYSELFPHRSPYVMMVPLQEILAEAIGGLVTSPKVQAEHRKLTDMFGGEFRALLEVATEEIQKISGEKVAEAIDKVRKGNITIDPGYDGVFGVVKIWGEHDKTSEENKKDQLSLF